MTEVSEELVRSWEAESLFPSPSCHAQGLFHVGKESQAGDWAEITERWAPPLDSAHCPPAARSWGSRSHCRQTWSLGDPRPEVLVEEPGGGQREACIWNQETRPSLLVPKSQPQVPTSERVLPPRAAGLELSLSVSGGSTTDSGAGPPSQGGLWDD